MTTIRLLPDRGESIGGIGREQTRVAAREYILKAGLGVGLNSGRGGYHPGHNRDTDCRPNSLLN